jgi:hypothetical protein
MIENFWSSFFATLVGFGVIYAFVTRAKYGKWRPLMARPV